MNKTIASKKYLNLIEWLKHHRIQQELSMRSLAERLSQPHTFIQKVESLERKLDVYEFAQYCEALQLDPCEGIRRYLL